MKTLKDLTPEIISKIPEYQKKVIEPIYNGSKYNNFNLEKAKKAVEWNYKKCGFKTPIVLVTENPLEQQYLFNYLKLNQKKYEKILYVLNNEFVEIVINNVKCQISSYFLLFFNFNELSIDTQLNSQLDSQLGSQLRNQLNSQLRNQLDNQLDSQLNSQLDSQLGSQLRNQLISQLGSQLNNQLDSQLNIQLYNQLRNQLDNQLDSQLRNQLISQLNSQLYNQLGRQLHTQLRIQLDSQLDNQLCSQLNNQLCSQLSNQLDDQLNIKEISKYNNNYLFTLNIYSEIYYTWYEFIRKEFNLDLTINEDFQECFKLHSESGIYSAIFSEAVCVISKYPLEIYQNKENNYALNNLEKNAVVWSNSFAPLDCYYVNGVNISKELFFKLKNKEYTFDEWSKEENEEVKSLVLFYFEEQFGGEYVCRFLSEHLSEIDTYTHIKEEKYLEGTTKNSNIGVYTLFKGNINNIDIAYVRCYCPSTDRIFFLGVNEDITNAKDAIASLCQIPLDLKDNLITITRCGEIYSFNFDEKGVEKIKNNQINIENVVSLTGNEYFSKLIWEY